MKKLLLSLILLLSFGFASSAKTVLFQTSTATGNPEADEVVNVPGVSQTSMETGNEFCALKFSNAHTTSGYIRWYASATLSVTPAEGVTINSVEFLCGDGKFGKISLTGGETITTSAKSPTATFANLNATEALTFTAPAQVRMSYVLIDYTEPVKEEITLEDAKLVVKAGETEISGAEAELIAGTVVTWEYDTEGVLADITYSYQIGDDAEVEGNSYTFDGNETSVTFMAKSGDSVAKKTVKLVRTYPTECATPVFSVEDGATVFLGSTITVTAEGAESLMLEAGDDLLEGSDKIEYVVAGEDGATLTLYALASVTGKDGAITAEKTITVHVAVPLDATYNFKENTYGLNPQTGSTDYEPNNPLIPGQPVSELNVGVVTIKLEGEKYRLWVNKTQGNNLRCQSGSHFTVCVPDELYITDIEFTAKEKLTSVNPTVGEFSGTDTQGSWVRGDLMLSAVKFSPTATQVIYTITVKCAKRPQVLGIGYVLKGNFKAIDMEYNVHVKGHIDGANYKLVLTVDGVEQAPIALAEPVAAGEAENAPARVPNKGTTGTSEGATHSIAGEYSIPFADETDNKTAHTIKMAVLVNDVKAFESTEEISHRTTTGIEDVTVEGAEAAEYYNLQGIRVAQPEAGRVYIVRRGAKAEKVLF